MLPTCFGHVCRVFPLNDWIRTDLPQLLRFGACPYAFHWKACWLPCTNEIKVNDGNANENTRSTVNRWKDKMRVVTCVNFAGDYISHSRFRRSTVKLRIPPCIHEITIKYCDSTWILDLFSLGCSNKINFSMRSHQSIDQRRHSTNLLPDLYTEHAHQPELKAKQKGIMVFRSETIFEFFKASWDGRFQNNKFRNGLWKKVRIIHMIFACICTLQIWSVNCKHRISQTPSTCQSFNEISALIRGKIRIYKLLVEFAGLWNSICLQFTDQIRKVQMQAKRITCGCYWIDTIFLS